MLIDDTGIQKLGLKFLVVNLLEVHRLAVTVPHVTEIARELGYQGATDLYAAISRAFDRAARAIARRPRPGRVALALRPMLPAGNR